MYSPTALYPSLWRCIVWGYYSEVVSVGMKRVALDHEFEGSIPSFRAERKGVLMKRTWNERRHYDQKVMRRRWNLLRNAWNSGWYPPKHFLSKYNLVCSCGMCRGEKYNRSHFKRETQR